MHIIKEWEVIGILSERKRRILRAVINENIEKPQAVSSKDLHEKYFEDVSSATIRNDLMALEEMGYLFQPHTSAGRVPTLDGFKKYINELMPEKELTEKELLALKAQFNSKISGMEDLAQVVAHTLSTVTEYASVVYVDDLLSAVVESVKIVRLTDDEAIVLVVTDLGVMKDLTVTIDDDLTDEDLVMAGKFLTQVIGGMEISEIDGEIVEEQLAELAECYRALFGVVLDAITKRESKPIVKVDGTSNLLNQPEYNNPEQARKTLQLFESKEILAPLIKTGNDVEISIKVGEDENQNCSVVSATYKINGKSVGRAGIVGPVRMDYAKAVSVLKGVNNVISEEFNERLQRRPKGQKHK